jgi:hypothetical protein
VDLTARLTKRSDFGKASMAEIEQVDGISGNWPKSSFKSSRVKLLAKREPGMQKLFALIR